MNIPCVFTVNMSNAFTTRGNEMKIKKKNIQEIIVKVLMSNMRLLHLDII